MNMDNENMEKEQNFDTQPVDENSGVLVEGHIKIFDPETQEIYIDKRNAINFENMSEALALSVANKSTGFIHEMHFGNGGTNVDATGIITYLPPNSVGANANLYNRTYFKVVDNNSVLNNDPTRNKIEVRHIPSKKYTDILVTCLLDYGEPIGQNAFDNATDLNGDFVFDELGLKSWPGSELGVGQGKLLTHVIFHPVQKSLNRLIQIDYTVRIQTLTSLTSNS
jgi:hypothetical protein